MVASILEESPDSLKQRCRVTPGRGNPTESATEMKPPMSAWGRVKRWSKSPPGDWQQDPHGEPHQEQCRIGSLRGADRATDIASGLLLPKGSGWQLEGHGQPWFKRNGHPRGQPLDRIRLIGRPRVNFHEKAADPC